MTKVSQFIYVIIYLGDGTEVNFIEIVALTIFVLLIAAIIKPSFSIHLLSRRANESTARNALNCIG